MMIIYLTGVAINLVILIKVFSDNDFIEIMNNNFPMTDNQKIIFLLSCSLSWIIPIYLILKKR